MKYIFLLIWFINFYIFSQTESRLANLNNVYINLNMKLQFADNIEHNNTFNFFASRGDVVEMLNTQFVGYEIQVKTFKNFFISFQQSFSYDHVGLKEYYNDGDYPIVVNDINAWYVRYEFFISYYFKIKRHQLSIGAGLQRTGADEKILYYVKDQTSGYWYPIDQNFSSYGSNNFELNYHFKKIKIGVGYEIGLDLNGYNLENPKFSMYYFSLAYNILKL